MLRVLNVHSGNLYGGIEVFQATMARVARACGVDEEFALCFEGRIADELRAAGIVVHSLGELRWRNPLQVLQARRALATLLAKGRYDVAVSHSVWSLSLFGGVIQRAGVPHVFHMHDSVGELSWLERAAQLAPRPALVLCNSQFTASTLDKLFPAAPRSIIPYPVSLQVAPRGARAELRRELGAPDGAVVILQASRMQSWKGHELHIAALARLRARTPWACWMVGGAQRAEEHEYEAHLRALVHDAGLDERVKFLGQRSDVPSLMAAADVFCQPNKTPEPFGIVFVEALAAGLPVVATRMGGPAEIVDASCGLLAPPGDAAAVAEGLAKLVDDAALRSAMSAPAKARARHLCEPEAQVRKIGEALASVCRGGSAKPTEERVNGAVETDVERRAALSLGGSAGPIHDLVRRIVAEDQPGTQTLIDVGCGTGKLRDSLRGVARTYIGCDVVRYDGFPADIRFIQANLNLAPYPIEDGSADVVTCVETIEHLENPRLLIRELVRVVRPGGLVVVTTPNQLSFLSRLSLVTKGQFQSFRGREYPAHITALVEADLVHIAEECGLEAIRIRFTDSGRVPGTPYKWPAPADGRLFSDNLALVARRPRAS